MANEIKKIKVNNVDYSIVDQGARDLIANLTLNGIKFIISDSKENTPAGVTNNSISGSDKVGTLTAAMAFTDGAGQIFLVSSSNTPDKDYFDEYIVVEVNTGGGKEYRWERLGNTEIDFDNLGDLAYKDSASGSYKPEGTISVSVSTSNSSKDVTPAGTVSQPTFTGTEGEATATYKPKGTVSKPNITVTPTTDEIQPVSSVGSLPTWSASVDSSGTLSFNFGQGSLPSLGSAKEFLTGATAVLASNPTFTGTQETIKSSYTPEGSVSQPEFTGTGKTITVKEPSGASGTFTGTTKTITVS